MNRTVRAALLAAFIAFAVVAGIGMFLGVDAGLSVTAGLVFAALSALLLLAAARRADSFHPTDEVTPPSPGFPGAPDRPDGSPSDPTDPAFDDEDR